MKYRALLCISVIVLAVVPSVRADVMILPANQALSGPPRWHNVENVYLDDALYAVDTCTSNKLDTFSVGLAEPADTVGKMITNVVIYAKTRAGYPKAMMWLWPVFSGTSYRSGNLKIGTTETTFSFDITPQDSTLADTTWNWEDIAGLGIRYQPRTTKVAYLVNHMFAAVTYVDTINVQAAHTFAFDPIATPETVGVAFAAGIRALDSLGALMTGYNGTALISDLTGTVSPVMVTFAGGLASPSLTISDTLRGNFLVIDDGIANDTSGLFDVVNSGLHHFAFDSIGMQLKDVPFAVSISARDFFDDTVTTFTGQADLWDISGTLTPDSTGAFAAGVWSGSVNIAVGNLYDSIACSYFNGKTVAGLSRGFWVDDPLGVSGEKPAPAGPGSCRLEVSPNPFNQKAEFSVYSPGAGKARIIVYNLLGQKAAQKDLGVINPGTVKLNWDFGTA
ncbi:MAG: hypothetical protein Q7U87_03665, partial [bacterium]|nr:hypothetical protein [bacterium]